MDNKTTEDKKNLLASKVNTAKDIPLFSDRQLAAFNSKYVDSYDEALAVLDEANRLPGSDQENE